MKYSFENLEDGQNSRKLIECQLLFTNPPKTNL